MQISVALGRLGKTGKHFYSRGLARAVNSEEREYFTLFNRQGQSVNRNDVLHVVKSTYVETDTGVMVIARLFVGGKTVEVTASGNGRLDAINNAIRKTLKLEYVLEHYAQHALEEKSTSQAAAYVGIRIGDKTHWGAGIDSDIIESSVHALVSAVNRMLAEQNET